MTLHTAAAAGESLHAFITRKTGLRMYLSRVNNCINSIRYMDLEIPMNTTDNFQHPLTLFFFIYLLLYYLLINLFIYSFFSEKGRNGQVGQVVHPWCFAKRR